MGSGFKMPTADDIWDWKLPSISIDDPMDSMYTLLQGNLPYEFGEKLYPNPRYSLHGSSFLENFLDGDEYLPFLRFTSTLVLLDKLAADPFFEEGDRRHVDREKVAMFFRILGGEIPIDSKTSKGSSFNADTIADFPSQARSVVDQCQFWAHITKWGDMAFLLMIPKEPLEALFNNFQSQVKSPVGTEDLRQKLIRGEEGIAGLQQVVYSLYIKLGILERALQRASHTRTEGDKFPITRQCIVDLCNELAIATVGGLDDTTRSQIRAIPDKMTNYIGTTQFFDGWKDMWKNNLVQNFLESPLTNYPAIIEIILADPDRVKRGVGREFINSFAQEMEVWVN